MSDLDSLLASLLAAAEPELQKLPLLDAAVFAGAATDRDVRVAESAAHTYVGCLGRWLFDRGALVMAQIEPSQPGLTETTPTRLSPAEFSKRVLKGRLYESAVDPQWRPFVVEYVRGTSLYGDDYVEANVVPIGARDVFDVEDSEATFRATRAQIDQRYEMYQQGDPAWRTYRTVDSTYDLTPDEKTPEGWRRAFQETLQRDALPEQERRVQLARFWALVDSTATSTDRATPGYLLQSFNARADDGVMQSVLNALASMPFEHVWDAVVADAERLQAEGNWLEAILGLWRNDLNDEQLEYVRASLLESNATQLGALRAATEIGLQARSPWARKLRPLLDLK